MKRLLAIVAAALLIITPAVAADAPTAPFKTPAAVQAYNKHEFRIRKAREAYEREVANAREEYANSLKKVAEAVARSGNSEELKAIADAQAALNAQNEAAAPPD